MTIRRRQPGPSPSMTDLQRRYWDKISDHYQDSTEIAQDDFHYGPRIPGEHRLKLLPPLSPGMRTLELGCGGAQNSIWLARRGACCTAVDLSSRQLNHAARLAQEAKVRIDLIHAPLEQFDRHV